MREVRQEETQGKNLDEATEAKITEAHCLMACVQVPFLSTPGPTRTGIINNTAHVVWALLYKLAIMKVSAQVILMKAIPQLSSFFPDVPS